MTPQFFGKQKRILLGQLGRRGDCLYATTIARQIKNDYPDCHLTWAISSMCRSVIEGNPFVDEIWELPLNSYEEIVASWQQFEIDVKEREDRGEYDKIYLTQIDPGNYQNYDGTVRASIYRGYPNPITVPMQPVIRLSESEIEKVRRFVESHDLGSKKEVVLFECAATSGQSFVDPKFALEVAKKVLNKNKDTAFILSSDKSVRVTDSRIIDGSVLSFRENAELTKYCSLLVGCSSGVSWLATSDWAKPLPKIQVLNADTMMYASMIHDAIYCGFSTDQIIEMTNCSPKHVASCIQTVFDYGFDKAKNYYHKDIPLDFSFYFKQHFWAMISRNDMGKAAYSLKVTMERFGENPQLIYYLQNIFLPYCNIIWSRIPQKDQTIIVKNLNISKRDSKIGALKQLYDYLKVLRALFRKDTRSVVIAFALSPVARLVAKIKILPK
jgi:hypothetical protein